MPDKTRFFYGYTIVIISFIAMMLLLGLHTVFGIFVKPIIAELGWTRTVTSGAFSLSQLMFGLLGIVIGGLNDRFGPRVVMTLCGLLAGLGYLLMSQVQTVWQMYLLFGVMIGVGSSVYVPLLSTVARWFVRRRNMMTGIVFAGAGVGMLVLPLVIDRLISAFDWRLTFLILGAIILVVVVVTAQFLRCDPGQVGQVAYGRDGAVEASLHSETRAFSLKEAMLTRPFWLLCVTLVFYGFCFFSLQVHIVPYLTDRGISAASAAIILTTIGGATIIGQVGLGSTGDRIGSKRAFLTGIILIALAVFTLMLARELWTFYIFAILLGLAFGGLASHGVILGVFAFTFTLGAAVGPLLFGYIFDVTGNYNLAFLVCAAIAVAAVILTVFLKPPATGATLKTTSSKAL